MYFPCLSVHNGGKSLPSLLPGRSVRMRPSELGFAHSSPPLNGGHCWHSLKGLLRRYRGSRHSRCTHRTAAPAALCERWNSSGGGGDRASPGMWARKFRMGTLEVPRRYSGGACRVGGVGHPAPRMRGGDACNWTVLVP